MFRLKTTFKIFCVIAAISLIVWQMYEYNYSEEDKVNVIFQRFNSDQQRIYPSLTLCFDGTTNPTPNDTSHQNLLKEEFFRSGSNDTTLKVEKYIKVITVKDFHNNIIRYSKEGNDLANGIQGRTLSTNIVFRRYKVGNCFAIGIPFMAQKEIHWINVEIKKSIFESGGVPTKQDLVSGKGKFSVGLTYQNQFFPLLNGKEKEIGKHEIQNECPGFVVNVRGIEIVHKRNKPTDPCNDDGFDDSTKVLEDLTAKLGCKPEYWNIPSNLPDCTKEELAEFRDILDDGLYNSNSKRLIRPCRYMQYLWHDYTFDTSCMEEKGTFHIKVVYNSLPYKEIQFVPSHTLWGLTTNVLTIVGVFLGVSLYQTPNLLHRAKHRIERIFHPHQDERPYTVPFLIIEEEVILSHHFETRNI